MTLSDEFVIWFNSSSSFESCMASTVFTSNGSISGSGKFQYTSIILLIINNIYRSQCTNSVLWEKLAASRSKWIWNNCHPLEIFNCDDLLLFTGLYYINGLRNPLKQVSLMCLMNRMMRDSLHGEDVENNSSIELIRRFLGLHTVNLAKNR